MGPLHQKAITAITLISLVAIIMPSTKSRTWKATPAAPGLDLPLKLRCHLRFRQPDRPRVRATVEGAGADFRALSRLAVEA